VIFGGEMIKVSRAVTGIEEVGAVKNALDRGYYGLAEKVLEFEEDLRKYLAASCVVALSSGSAALHLALDALGVGEGDEVIVPSLTFVACFQAISATRAKPVPCEIYPNTLLMDIDDVRKKINAKTKVIMPVHYAGNPCEMDSIQKIAEANELRVVEDAAHALGSYYKGRKIGSFGDIIVFSFDSIKNITCGEGGAVICQDPALAELLRQKRLIGIDRKSHTALWKDRKWDFDVKTQGFRYHMSNINAAIGIEQLKKIDRFIKRRKEICKIYDQSFSGLTGLSLLDVNYDVVAPHIYVIRVKNNLRDALLGHLKEMDIETSINYIPNHLHSFYKEEKLSLPETEKAYQEILTLPLHCGLSDKDVERVITEVKSFFSEKPERES